MVKRKPTSPPLRPFKKETSAVVNGHQFEAGVTEFGVHGSYGRFVFHAFVTNEAGDSWIDAWPVNGHGGWRSFHPDKIRKVYRKKKKT